MPVRLLREGILDSEAVNSLSPEAEVFYRRLMSVVDDFGRFDGRTSVLRGRLYALQLEKVREANLERWIAECVKARLIRLYFANSKPYISFLKLGEPRAKVSKYPPPPDDSQTDENICAQTPTCAPYSGSNASAPSGSDSTGGAAPPPAAKPTPKPRKEPEGVHHDFTRAFVGAWEDRYPNERYPHAGKKDGEAVKWFIDQLRADLEKFRAIVGRYLASTDPFFNGHPMSLLRNQFAKFLVDAPAPRKPTAFQTHDDRVGDVLFGGSDHE